MEYKFVSRIIRGHKGHKDVNKMCIAYEYMSTTGVTGIPKYKMHWMQICEYNRGY